LIKVFSSSTTDLTMANYRRKFSCCSFSFVEKILQKRFDLR
jgi:hypothetical protein